MEYFYDKQFKKYIAQILRLFAHFKVEIGTMGDGTPLYRTVPVNYGDISRMAANIMKNNSENVLNTAPFFSVYITGLDMAPDRRTYPQFSHSTSVVEKRYDENTGSYVNEPGERYSVERQNPVPYNMNINVDLWTTNNDQKFQLFEQVLILYNPSINLRTNSSPVDWSSLTYMEMVNSTWSSRSIPSGTDDVIDVATFQFKLPILLNPPVKVKRETLIHTVITKLDVVDGENLKLFNAKLPFETQYRAYTIITIENYKLSFEGNRAIILNENGGNTDPHGNLLDWNDIFCMYGGNLREGISQIKFKLSNNFDDDSDDIVAVIESIDPINKNELIITVDTDTLPTDTLPPILAVINPQSNYPNDGTLSASTIGQRYLLTDEVGIGGVWGVNANANDIIEYNGVNWQVIFDSNSVTTSELVFDIQNEEQYEWTGSKWVKSYTGIYNQGYWKLFL